MGGGGGKQGRIKEMRASRRTRLCLQSIIAAERRVKERLFHQTDMLLSKALSFIRIDAYVSPSTTGCAWKPVASAVGEARTCRHACVWVWGLLSAIQWAKQRLQTRLCNQSVPAAPVAVTVSNKDIAHTLSLPHTSIHTWKSYTSMSE